jgi:hypothetical protein
MLAPNLSGLVQLSVAKCYLLTDATTAALTTAAPVGLEQIDVSRASFFLLVAFLKAVCFGRWKEGVMVLCPG